MIPSKEELVNLLKTNLGWTDEQIQREIDKFRKKYDYYAENEKLILYFIAQENKIHVTMTQEQREPQKIKIAEIEETESDTRVLVEGTIIGQLRKVTSRAGNETLRGFIADNTGIIQVIFIGDALKKELKQDMSVRVIGKVYEYAGRKMLTVYDEPEILDNKILKTRTIEELEELDEIPVTIEGVVAAVNTREYAGCPVCYKKINETVGAIMSCPYCGSEITVKKLVGYTFAFGDKTDMMTCELPPWKNLGFELKQRQKLRLIGVYDKKRAVFRIYDVKMKGEITVAEQTKKTIKKQSIDEKTISEIIGLTKAIHSIRKEQLRRFFEKKGVPVPDGEIDEIMQKIARQNNTITLQGDSLIYLGG